MEDGMSNVDQEKDTFQSAKKVKLFCAKEFRKKLSSNEKLTALQKFLDLCYGDDGDAYIFQYLEVGGNCLELFQLLETSTEVPALLTLEVVHLTLLQIVSNYPQYHSSANETCRYFLNTHMALINKLLSLASTSKERKILLRLLTVMVTLSGNLAKDILLHVNFNPTNLEVLSKQVGEKDSVRNVFIQFLMSFLVKDEYPIISILLEKKGLLSSIMQGLQYDESDTVCLVMTTLQKYILENSYVSKTAKMKVFSTPVVKDIVNLYNWKGPEGFIKKRKQHERLIVDEYEKSQVNEKVHSFLLVLCTSHKYGVVFKDYQLGLGKRTHNSLMYTVMENLERPWEHSYAGDLITKICGACPDLVKTMWANLKEFIEPRLTVRWLNAIKYAMKLVQELDPTAIEFCVHELSPHQLAQVIQYLVAPTPILKTIIPEDRLFKTPIIKHYILSVLVEFLKAVKKFLQHSEKWCKLQDYRLLKKLLNEHISRIFLDAHTVLLDCFKRDDDETLGPYSILSNLEIIFDLLDLYQCLCPQLLESLSVVNFQDFFNKIQNFSNEENSVSLQIRAINLFMNFEPSLFAPKTDLFAQILPITFGVYFNTKDIGARSTLNLLFKNSGIFEGCLEEINIWIDAIVNTDSYDADTGRTIAQIIAQTSENLFEYLKDMSTLSEECYSQIENDNIQDILENLTNNFINVGINVKHQNLSPLLLGACKCLSNVIMTKNFKYYFNYVLLNLLHSQTSSILITNIILDPHYKDLISKYIRNYTQNWCSDFNAVVLLKSKVRQAEEFSKYYLEGDVSEFFENYKDVWSNNESSLLRNCLHQTLFYFCKFNYIEVTNTYLQNTEKVIKFLISNDDPKELMTKIFRHPILLQHFSPIYTNKNNFQGFSTVLLIDIVKEYKKLNLHKQLTMSLKPFRAKLVNSLKKVFKKSAKKNLRFLNLVDIFQVFGLELEHCQEILTFCSNVPYENLETECLSFFYNIIIYALNQFIEQTIDYQSLPNDIVQFITSLLTFLNKREEFDTSSCASNLNRYTQMFPHCIKIIKPECFESLLTRNGFCRENAFLSNLLLSKRPDFLEIFEKNLSNVSTKKGLMLALLQAAIDIKADDEILKNAYEHFEPSILKSIHKPQKAGQFFEMYHEVPVVLIKKFLPEDTCKNFVEKVHKFEVSEPFHVEILITIFNKILFDTKKELSEVHLNNVILTLVHLTNLMFKKKLDSDDKIKLNKIIMYTISFLENNLINKKIDCSFRTLCESNTFQIYCKSCLKFGLLENALLIKVIRCIAQFVNFEEKEAQLLLEMVGSHSEFLNVMLSDQTECKVELLHLILVLCERWPSVMQRNHIPVLLAAYNGTVKPSDRITLKLLQSYEKATNQTSFYDFKPFLWGTAAAAHYSVRQDIQKALWRQPKMRDILDILKEEQVLSTVINFPLESELTITETNQVLQNQNVYDLAFFLPLFSYLLAPENETATSKFVKSGALSLVVVALSSNNNELRMAACHVLARFHYHIEANPNGKDRLLWVRYVEAVCRGTAVLDDFKLNSFTAIFWAKMALIISQPTHPLYVSMFHYLSAKSTPYMSGVPELYTFLHSSELNYKVVRKFILKILHDGLRRESDFIVALHSMSFKLIMELFSSCVADLETKVLILGIFENACNFDKGRQLLCSSYGLLSWLYEVVNNNYNDKSILSVVVRIMKNILQTTEGLKFTKDLDTLRCIVGCIIDKELVSNLQNEVFNFLQIISVIFNVDKEFINEQRLKTIISIDNTNLCNYLLENDCKYFTPKHEIKELEITLIILKTWLNK